MSNKINETVINKIVSEIEHEVMRFKENKYSQKEVRRFINKSYIRTLLTEKADDNFCFVGDEKLTVKAILKRVNQAIKKHFYSKYDSKNYYAPIIEKINVDSNYDVLKVGNVNEITFEDFDKLGDGNLDMDYSTGGKLCNFEQEFTADGKLIVSCNLDSNDEEQKDT